MIKKIWFYSPLLWICLSISAGSSIAMLFGEADAVPILLWLALFWFSLTMVAILNLGVCWWEFRSKALCVMAVQCATPILLLGLLKSGAPEFISWKRRSSTLQRAAARIIKLKPPDGTVKLMADERRILRLSAYDEAEINHHNGNLTIVFVTGRTAFNGNIGYIYSSQDVLPEGELQQSGYLELEATNRIEPHWFRCVSRRNWD